MSRGDAATIVHALRAYRLSSQRGPRRSVSETLQRRVTLHATCLEEVPQTASHEPRCCLSIAHSSNANRCANWSVNTVNDHSPSHRSGIVGVVLMTLLRNIESTGSDAKKFFSNLPFFFADLPLTVVVRTVFLNFSHAEPND